MLGLFFCEEKRVACGFYLTKLPSNKPKHIGWPINRWFDGPFIVG
jgi:hypothetical protein